MNLPVQPIYPAAKVYFGKYRGLVVENDDPMQTGRIMAQVPDVLGTAPSAWAMPCVPFAGAQAGIFVVPSIGSQVWMEFERGNPDYPIWTGGFWGSSASVPPSASIPAPVPPGQNIVIQTTLQNAIIASDAPPTPATGGIILRAADGATIVVNSTGIYLNNGQGATVSLIGPEVFLNNVPGA